MKTINISNRYDLIARINDGSGDPVYKAYDRALDKPVVIRALANDICPDDVSHRRFRTAARTTARLKHPNIVATLDCGFYKDRPFLVMEYFEGLTLEEYLDSNGPLSLEQAIAMFLSLCDALEYAHEMGIVHRNIDAKSILLSFEDGKFRVKIAGFERSYLTQQLSTKESTMTIGSPGADIEGLGMALLKSIAAGWDADLASLEERDTFFARMARLPRISRRYGFGVMEMIIERCLAENPAESYHSVANMAHDLRDLRGRLAIWAEDYANHSVDTIEMTIERQKDRISRKVKSASVLVAGVFNWLVLPVSCLAIYLKDWLN